MTTKNFTTTLLLEASPTAVFDAITNVRSWWSEDITGNAARLHDIFEYQYGAVHRSKIQLTEVIPDEKIVWHVLENQFNFTEDPAEWTDDTITFEITKAGGKTRMQMEHYGLVPQCECYEACREGWTHYIQTSLKNLIETGTGVPNAKGTANTPTERKLSGQ